MHHHDHHHERHHERHHHERHRYYSHAVNFGLERRFGGGVVGLLGYAILALLVHPQEEPLDRSCQCTRHWYHRARDAKHRAAAKLEVAAVRKTVVATAVAVAAALLNQLATL